LLQKKFTQIKLLKKVWQLKGGVKFDHLWKFLVRYSVTKFKIASPHKWVKFAFVYSVYLM